MENNNEAKADVSEYQGLKGTTNIPVSSGINIYYYNYYILCRHVCILLIIGEVRRMQDYKSNAPLYDPNVPVKWSCCEWALMMGAWILCIIPIFWFFIPKTVRDYERALIFRLGKLTGAAKGPGVFLINPLTDTIYVVDLRIETYNLPPQGMMTKDAVTVDVDAICFMKVISPVKVRSCIRAYIFI